MVILKVYDCFTFYNELELLELRLKSFYNIVDYFVIVEATRTQNNLPKKLYFEENKAAFAQFFPKIRHIIFQAESVPYTGVGDWSIEVSQRNAIMAGLKDAEPEDLVFISDLDEFPSIDILYRIYNHQEDTRMFSQYPPPPPSRKSFLF